MSEKFTPQPLQFGVVANPETGGEHSNVVHWVFPGETLRIGRARRPGQLSLSGDDSLSKEHFEIVHESHVCLLRDLGSANGTLVNGTRVRECGLQNGDEINAGQTTFLVTALKTDDADNAVTKVLLRWPTRSRLSHLRTNRRGKPQRPTSRNPLRWRR